jgi:putative DNA primase/helicase
VKRAEGLSGPSSLYILVIADSGERKTSSDKHFTKGIDRFEKDAALNAMPSITQYETDIEAWDMKVRGVKAQILNFAKTDQSTVDSEAMLKILMQNKPIKLKLPRFLYTDTTPEELAYSLSQTWPTGGIMSSEAGLVFGGHGMGKDVAMRAFALYNVLWDGGSFQVDRRTSQSFAIENARLTILLQVQESTLREFIRKTGDLARGTGFFARFLLCWPESTQGYRPFSDPPFYTNATNAFNDRLYDILKAGKTIDHKGNLTPSMLKLSAEAKQAWIVFHDDIERQLVLGGQYQEIRDVASKIADNAARLAGLIHVFEGNGGQITLGAFAAAQSVVQWHLDESSRFFSQFTMPVELADAARLERWLVDICRINSTEFIRKNDVRQKGPVREKKALESAIDELVTLNRIRKGKTGRAVAIFVNPAVLSAQAG